MRVHADSFSVYEIVNRILRNDAPEGHQCHGNIASRKMDREHCVLVAKDSHDLAYESKSYKYVFFYVHTPRNKP